MYMICDFNDFGCISSKSDMLTCLVKLLGIARLINYFEFNNEVERGFTQVVRSYSQFIQIFIVLCSASVGDKRNWQHL